ncbi:MAG TPA: ASKHA domain-containing protein [Anaerolineales bacterium]|nr:ASKHA domain-containing protein [Anaerolineales bacterium]HMX21181.1 ASKHA domain-containing protein [Anaerolineales bacterium]HMX75389.1 ASKHA domain-containing protein [Anaerolineales bacterium]HMZ44187.1 ASKHA domain-containing protein [Anaerolineales bacterium]HNA55349.1 ASKHA domain-containing protein [Anaerolineales bacterium]
MNKHNIILQPSGRRGQVEEGMSVRSAARELGVEIESICAENATCGKCMVLIEEGRFEKYNIDSKRDNVSPVTTEERAYLERRPKLLKDKGWEIGQVRLSCQAKVCGDVLINVPEESRGNKQIVRKSASSREIEVKPAIRKYLVSMSPPTLERPIADWERLAKGLETSMALVRGTEEKLPRWHELQIDYHCLKTLSPTLRAAKWNVTVSVWQDKEVIEVQPGYVEDSYGAAVDIGSTTVALYLCNLRTGEMLAAESEMNPQIVYGEDVMSRIQYTIEHKDGLEKLHKAIISTLNKLLKQAAKTAKIKTEEILEMVLVGNSTMHHILLNLHPKDLGLAPFVPAIHKSMDIKARELGLHINSSGNIHVLPTIASFVGADTSAMIVAEEPHKQDENWLLIDVGTNAELVLGNRKRLVCTSTPTGPALEGAHVEYGMRAAPGAIERVHIDEKTLEPKYKVIGVDGWNTEHAEFKGHVKGICGSAIIDSVAELFRAGIVDSRGKFKKGLNSNRIREGESGWEYVIAWAEETSIGRDIPMTQQDVRQIQLAKAALFTAARTLLKRSGMQSPDKIILAGGFGSYIDKEKAMLIGLIPDCDLENVYAVGNAAGDGARIALLNVEKRNEIDGVTRKVDRFELPTDPEFQNNFMLATSFPHMSEPFEHIAHLIPNRVADPMAKNFIK